MAKHSDKQWELYGDAVEELDLAYSDMLIAIDLWIKNAAPITDPDNIEQMKEFRKEFIETISGIVVQHKFDLKIYD